MANNYVVLQILEVWKQTSCFRNFEDLEKFAPTVMLNSFKIEKKKGKIMEKSLNLEKEMVNIIYMFEMLLSDRISVYTW